MIHSCQVDLGKNPYHDPKKSPDSHFLKKFQGVSFSKKKTGDDSAVSKYNKYPLNTIFT